MSNQQFVFGINSVVTLLRTNAGCVKQLVLDKKRNDKRLQEIADAAQNAGITIKYEARENLDDLSQSGNHQGVVAFCDMPKVHDESFIDDVIKNVSQPLFLLLDGVQDPHNLGACLRTADAVGVNAVIIPKDRSVSINSTVVKVASGAAYSVPVVSVTNLSRSIREMQEAGVWFVGTDGEASETLFDISLTGSIALVLGAEGTGLRRLTREHCDFLARLPMNGSVESLNVSVAAGVCLYEALRQRNLASNSKK